MPRYHYQAIGVDGRAGAGEIEAPDETAAAAQLRAGGLFPVRLESRDDLRSPAETPARGWRRLGAGGLKPRERAVLTRQLATLLHAGLPLVRGLETLARQERSERPRHLLQSLATDIRGGAALSDAMARQPRAFDRLYVNMVRAGEAGGALDAVLDRLARLQEKSLRLRGKVRAALVYPLVVLALAGGILAVLLVVVVPRFQRIFTDLLKGAPLPALTQAVVTAGELARHHFAVGLAALAVLAAAGALARRSAVGAAWVDALVLRLPLAGDLVRKSLTAQFARTLATLLGSGVALLPALAITRETAGNRRIAGALAAVHERVKAGEPLAAPLEAAGVFPAVVTSLVDVGEQTGQLPAMLGQVADIFEDEVDHAVGGLSSVLEPVLIVLLAGVVGTIVIALFLPIIRVVQLLG